MTAPVLKTKAEQRLKRLQKLRRPLTDAESDDLRRALHATYCRERRLAKSRLLEGEWRDPILKKYDAEQAELLAMVEAEALTPEQHEERQ